MALIVAVVSLVMRSDDGPSASGSSTDAAQTTPLGCDLDGDAADIDCTEREVISRLCNQDAAGWPTPRRSNLNSSGPGLHMSEWFDSSSYGQLDRRANFQYRLQQDDLAAVTLICTPGGVQHIDVEDWYVLVMPGSPSDIPSGLR